VIWGFQKAEKGVKQTQYEQDLTLIEGPSQTAPASVSVSLWLFVQAIIEPQRHREHREEAGYLPFSSFLSSTGDRMTTLNNHGQIAVLRSESNRKIGEAYLALATAAGGDSNALAEARSHLLQAQDDLLELQRRNDLGKNYEHKLTLISAELDKTEPDGTGFTK
jgi:hypothetical protein